MFVQLSTSIHGDRSVGEYVKLRVVFDLSRFDDDLTSLKCHRSEKINDTRKMFHINRLKERDRFHSVKYHTLLGLLHEFGRKMLQDFASR